MKKKLITTAIKHHENGGPTKQQQKKNADVSLNVNTKWKPPIKTAFSSFAFSTP